MRKYAFLAALEKELNKEDNYQELIGYYQELIEEAILNGEDEVEFIKKLGTPVEIHYSLKNDDVFKSDIKNKKIISAKKTYKNTTMIISYTLIGLYCIFLGAVSITFIGSGISGIIVNILDLLEIIRAGKGFNHYLYTIFVMLFAMGVFFLGMILLIFVIKHAAKHFKLLRLKIDELTRKED